MGLYHLTLSIIAGLIIALGFFLPLDLYLSPRQGLGYYLGIIGALMMTLLFFYSVRKRIGLFHNFYSLRDWFEVHIFYGIFGPVFILYHCRYKLGATNSNIALWSMLIVFASGFVGRFLYKRIGWERPFKWWHYAHLPIVGLFVSAAIIHVIASFMY